MERSPKRSRSGGPQRGTSVEAEVQDTTISPSHRRSHIHTASPAPAASPRLDFGVSPNCASRLRECSVRTCTTAPVRKRAMMDEPTLTLPETNIGGYINTGWDSLSNLVGVTAA